MQDKVTIGMLNDYYGGILNPHQQEIMRLYFECDMSLSEVSEEMGITRQAVREILVRSTKKLTELEEKLKLVAKIKSVTGELEGIINKTESQETIKILTALLKDIKEI